MNKNIGIIVIAAAVLIGITALLPGRNEDTSERVAGISEKVQAEVILHKSPTCGCCGVYGSYLKKLGYGVKIHDTNDLYAVKEKLGVPREVESCHTSEIGGYVVEGHIPEEVIQKLLTEKPDIKGIGMGGMPSGSPGMPGPKTEDFVIYEITHEGTRGDVYMTL